MPFVPIPNVVAVEMRMLLDLQRIENTFAFRCNTVPDLTNMAALANDLQGWWTTRCAPLLPIEVSLVEVVVTDQTTSTSPRVSLTPTPPVQGTLGSPPLPNNVSLAVSFRTVNRGRSFQGRNYVPSLTESQVVANTVQAATVTDWQVAYFSIFTDVAPGGGDWQWVIASRFSGVDANKKPIPRSVGIATAVTSVVVVDPTVDSMRRRLPGRGR